MLSPETSLNSAQEKQAVLCYFGTLYYLIGSFPCEGAEVLQRNGYRSHAWVESLYELAADFGCFGREEPTKVVLPFEAIQPFITPEIVAVIVYASRLSFACSMPSCAAAMPFCDTFFCSSRSSPLLRLLDVTA